MRRSAFLATLFVSTIGARDVHHSALPNWIQVGEGGYISDGSSGPSLSWADWSQNTNSVQVSSILSACGPNAGVACSSISWITSLTMKPAPSTADVSSTISLQSSTASAASSSVTVLPVIPSYTEDLSATTGNCASMLPTGKPAKQSGWRDWVELPFDTCVGKAESVTSTTTAIINQEVSATTTPMPEISTTVLTSGATEIATNIEQTAESASESWLTPSSTSIGVQPFLGGAPTTVALKWITVLTAGLLWFTTSLV